MVDDDSIFEVMTSNVTTLHMLYNELGLFYHSYVKPKYFILLLTWWKSPKTPFPNVSFVL